MGNKGVSSSPKSLGLSIYWERLSKKFKPPRALLVMSPAGYDKNLVGFYAVNQSVLSGNSPGPISSKFTF